MIEKQVHPTLNVITHGLQVSRKNPFFACSPDGVVSCKFENHKSPPCNKWLIEIKCPSSCKEKPPQEAAVETCGVECLNKVWTLKQDHKYYFQVQMQMGIMELVHCDFIVHTKKGNFKVEVPFNEQSFNKMSNSLNQFVKMYLFPHLVRRLMQKFVN